MHTSLHFTVDDVDGSFPFLNVDIEINGQSVDTWVFRKKTHTGVMLNFCAIVPNFWKTGLIRCLLNNAKMICSSQELLNKEIEKLKLQFLSNGYPKRFFEKTLEKFRLVQDMGSSVECDNEIEETERRYLFGIPYLGIASQEYKKKVTALIKEHLAVDISSYYTSCKVSRFFSLKSSTPLALKARVVYKFSCLSDSDTYYIGKTKRHLVSRAKEHVNPKETNQPEVKNHILNVNPVKKGFHQIQCRILVL